MRRCFPDPPPAHTSVPVPPSKSSCWRRTSNNVERSRSRTCGQFPYALAIALHASVAYRRRSSRRIEELRIRQSPELLRVVFPHCSFRLLACYRCKYAGLSRRSRRNSHRVVFSARQGLWPPAHDRSLVVASYRQPRRSSHWCLRPCAGNRKQRPQERPAPSLQKSSSDDDGAQNSYSEGHLYPQRRCRNNITCRNRPSSLSTAKDRPEAADCEWLL